MNIEETISDTKKNEKKISCINVHILKQGRSSWLEKKILFEMKTDDFSGTS